ncbi:hypothetical protein [Pectobacterium parmentieri]|uniref:hypothetical protein n=1 Tax=Pectobacterium parmentieri TaxID=1905730 RepID=UPI00217D7408|nr:hypothetical protein [Pectobacterium parmentieri]
MPNNYYQYIEDVSDDIKTCLEGMGCQPILFVGSGLTKRYLSGPNWEELLQQLATECPNIDKKFAYYKQKYPELIDIGSVFLMLIMSGHGGMVKNTFLQSYLKQEMILTFTLNTKYRIFLTHYYKIIKS